MSIVTKSRVYTTGDNLPANYYNADRDEVIAGVNSINNAQVASNAGILESKILFSNSGHGHTGGTDGAVLTSSAIDTSTITLPEAQVTFDNSAGHSHNGTDSNYVKVTSLDPVGLTPLYYLRVDAGGTNVESVPVAVSRNYVFVDYKDLDVENNVGVNPITDSDVTFTAINAYVKTAPVGADIIITITDVAGTPITTVTIADGENNGSAVISAPVVAGTFMQMNVTQIGSTTAGSYLTVTVSGIAT